MVQLLTTPSLRKEENITIMRKNVIKFAAIALLSAFALTACDDDIMAKPEGYGKDSPVVDIAGADIYHNNFDSIYDSIRSGALAGDVLNELLYQYSVSVFGNYNAVTASKISTDLGKGTTLKAAVASLAGDKAAAKEFIKSHKAYWTKDKAGNRIDDSFKKAEDDADPSESEYARLQAKWDTIEDRIAKQLYSAVSGGSYSERSIFEEERYLRSLASSIDVNVVDDINAAPTFKGVITADVEDVDVFTTEIETVNVGVKDVVLHRSNYQTNGLLNQNEAATDDATYVEDKLIPDIYRQLLVEQYILDESYDTLGRTSARHISVLSISKNSDYSKGAAELMNTFVNTVIFNKDRHEAIDLDTFKMVSNAWVGAFMSNDDYATNEATKPMYDLMYAAVPEYKKSYDGVDKDGNPHTYNYFQGTAYGQMVEEFEKISDNPVLSENESSYTAGNTYTIGTGMEIKTNELKLKNHTSTGWYVKSTGASVLPDSLKNQLFDINVANAVDQKEDCVTYALNEAGDGWAEPANEASNKINVVGKISLKDANGKAFDQYFLRNTTRIKDDPWQNDILFESDGTYYIVLVEDAIRSKTLDKSRYGENLTKEQFQALEDYINEIVQIVANNDTYKTLSKKHWVEKMELQYHDQVIYDYFKNSFPELFDDED